MPSGDPALEAGKSPKDIRTGTTGEFLRLALAAYEAGKHGHAEKILAQITEQQPQNAAALHLRGLNMAAAGDLIAATQYFIDAVRRDTGNATYCASLAEHLIRQSLDHAALEPWQRAIDLAPDSADYHFAFANCLSRLGKYRDALPLFEEASRLDPTNRERLVAYGIALSKVGHHNDAIATLRKANDSAPVDAAAVFHLGFVLQYGGQPGDAADAYRRALAIDPTLSEARLNLAACLRELGDLSGCIEQCYAVLKDNPDSVSAMNNLGAAFCTLGRNVEAITQYRNALLHDPENLTALHNLGVALHAEGIFEEAEKILRKCLIINKFFTDAQRSLANLLRSYGALTEAASLYQAVIDQRPLDFKSYGNLGLVLLNLNKPHEAISVYEKALALEPDHADLKTGLGIAQLLAGDFENGWTNYNARLEMDQSAKWRPDTDIPLWRGEETRPTDDAHATVLVHAEQGFGDTLQFCRFLPRVQERGVSVIFECQPTLIPLIESLEPRTAGTALPLIDPSAPLPDADYHIPLMSLPGIFAANPDTIPSAPYLSAPQDRKAKWAETVPDGAFSVGLVWEGNPNRQDDRLRSCPLEAIEPIVHVAGARFFSLQKNMRQERYPTIGDLGPQLADFADTAAAIERLDLVISVDTAVAHLAGALGRPVWVMLGHAADWRYLLDRDDSPWYPTMRLFRQRAPNDWLSVTERIAGELEKVVLGPD